MDVFIFQLYKHVVQIVEKFIKKCKPEYKVPGLYVIDSIVRQSRHQFGTDKDVFGPRFSKNITATFQYLYLCPSEDKVGEARLECCCALMWCCLGACTPVTVIWGSSLTLVVTVAEKDYQRR